MISSAQRFSQAKMRNRLHSLVLFTGMIVLCCALGWLIFGWIGIVTLGVSTAILLALGPKISPYLILKMYKARRVTEVDAPELLRILKALAGRAGLLRAPALFYVRSQIAQAMSVGGGHEAAIVVTDGLLRNFSLREVTGVLAHEVSHVRHGDGWVMGLADMVSRLVTTLSWMGTFLLVVNLPLLLFDGARIPWLLILMLILAPTLSALMQLALSRTREYDADLEAAKLTRDPRGLASALVKLETIQGGFFERIFLPGRRIPQPSLLRTHPPTQERVQRLLELGQDLAPEEDSTNRRSSEIVDGLSHVLPGPPRWRISGLWY
jgi:heat shock protein HtpX